MAAVSIADQLKILIELQGIDAQIYRLKHQAKDKPQEAERLKAETQAAGQGVRAVEERYKAQEVKRNQMEIDLGEKENQIRKLQAQLFQIKTNKEYTAMQKEIEGFKADKSVLEEEILKLMEEADQVKARLAADREAQKAREEQLKKELFRVEEEMRAIQSSVGELQSAREALLSRVEPPILSQYERILERKEGVALVPVRDNTCGGCNIVLPPQVINEIQMYNRLIPCESCARILYLEQTG